MPTRRALRGATVAVAWLAVLALSPVPATATVRPRALTAQQRAVLHGIAQDTWHFYATDVDATTHLPLDNLGPGSALGAYTSAANIGVYLWSVIAARDLGLIDTQRADQLAGATLGEVATLRRYDGMLYQWYDTNNGNVLLNPGQGDCTETRPSAGQLLVRFGR